MIRTKIYVFVFTIIIAFNTYGNPVEKISLKTECLQTLYVLVDALLDLQVTDGHDPNFGALRCERCNIYHTRAGEAVFPFAIAYRQSGDAKYLKAAILVGNWLIKQQLPGGEWKETPEEWTGTTTDQLLMMTLAFPIVQPSLSEKEKREWLYSIQIAADYLTATMDQTFASINYVATTTASLAAAYQLTNDDRHLNKARKLAHEVILRFNEDGFLEGEGHRDKRLRLKYGVDIGYNLEMSLWGLGLYAYLTKDNEVKNVVYKSLKQHLHFIYPDGSVDNSWGIRSNKWTIYGSLTSDGVQYTFSQYGKENPQFYEAALRNLRFWKNLIQDGYLGYGPHHWEIFTSPPCVYPTFVKAKNLALAIEFGTMPLIQSSELPSDRPNWIKHFPTVDVVLVRGENYMCTVTGYNYKDLTKLKSKYMTRPTGGVISNLWFDHWGQFQVSSQTEYHRWEPMHFPEVGKTLSLTPRVEAYYQGNLYSNLYEFNSQLSLIKFAGDTLAVVTVDGYLTNKSYELSPVRYTVQYTFSHTSIEKFWVFSFDKKPDSLYVIEPFVEYKDLSIDQISTKDAVEIRLMRSSFHERKLIVEHSNASIILGKNHQMYWFPIPAMKDYPVYIVPEITGKNVQIRYKIL